MIVHFPCVGEPRVQCDVDLTMLESSIWNIVCTLQCIQTLIDPKPGRGHEEKKKYSRQQECYHTIITSGSKHPNREKNIKAAQDTPDIHPHRNTKRTDLGPDIGVLVQNEKNNNKLPQSLYAHKKKKKIHGVICFLFFAFLPAGGGGCVRKKQCKLGVNNGQILSLAQIAPPLYL